MQSATGASTQLKGILCMLVSNAVFGLTDALSKVLTSSYPPGEIIFFRTVFVCVTIAIMVQWQGGWGKVRIVDWRRQLARGCILAGSTYLFITALKYVPLADLTAMMFLSPIVLTAMAPYFLGESVGWRRWTAVAIGFCGALLIVRPSGDVPLWPMLLTATFPLTMSIRDILTRHLGKTDSANGMMIVSTLCVMAGGLASLPFGWEMPTWRGMGLFALTGTLQGAAQFFLVYAFVYGEAVVIAPFRYFLLLWATLYGWLFFDALPRLETVAGASIVCAAGLFIFYREMRHGRR